MSFENYRPEIKVKPPGPKAKAIIERDEKVSSPSLIKEYPLVVERGEGCWIYDVDGNRFLDFMAGIATTATGHSHPKVVSAIKNAADKFLHICATDFYYDSYTKLVEKLNSYLPGMGPKKVFLTNSGTEAVEGALKLARHYTKRSGIIAFKGAFHGRTYGALSLNSSKVHQRAFFGPFLPGVMHVPYPNPYRCPYKKSQSECAGSSCDCATVLEKDWFVNHVSPKEIAAIILEPILGEGGYIEPPKKFIQDLRRICDEHGILLIFDEVQTGAGRTGHMYASDYFGVYPDILCTAKGIASGMPIGAFVAREKYMTWGKGTHGSTYGGNPICAEAALATLEIVEGILPHIRDMGEHFKTHLKRLSQKHPEIGDIRGPGLFIGAEFVNPQTKAPAVDFVDALTMVAFEKGLLLLGCGKSSIRFTPPLIITKQEIDIGMAILEASIEEVKRTHPNIHLPGHDLPKI